MKCSRSVFSSVNLIVFLCVLLNQGRIADAQLNATVQTIDVGVILDLSTWVGRMTESCVSMALADYYSTHNNTATRLVLHIRDSHQDVVDAASSAVDLIKNVQVQAILGPQSSSEAVFVVDIGNKAHVPIISFTATSPSISFKKTPYFIRTTLNDSTQVKAIAAIVEEFGWREVVPVYEDTDYGEDMIPYLTDAIQDVNARVPYRSILSFSFTDDQIRGELYKLMTMQTRVFVVHMRSVLASRLFSIAKKVGMMKKGYAWIITDGITDLVGSLDASTVQSMQGVLGLKPYVISSEKLDNFRSRWKRKFILENPDIDGADLSLVGLLAYDSVWALAIAAEKVKTVSPRFKKPYSRNNSADLETLGVSQIGPYLLESILQTNMNGLSGEFWLKDGQLQSWAFQIVDVIGKGEREIGFWSPAHGILSKLNVTTTNTKDNLQPIIWPGETTEVPKGWELPTSEKKLKIGIPVKDGFSQFVKLQKNPKTNSTEVTGFCIDVFKAVIESIPYAIPYEFVPFEKASGQSPGSYNDLIYQVYLQKYDAVVGDVTILANRSKYVDFTLPFTESGVSMVVPVKNDDRKNAWIFLKPLTRGLWLITGLFFLIIGFVVWILEHRINEDFQGTRAQQVGIVFWFAFSTLVFAHKERLESNLARFVLIIWIFFVLILTSSYTANLTSMLTVQKFQPTLTDIRELIRNGDFVGYQKGSFVETGLMKSFGIDPNKTKAYDTVEQYHDALLKGSRNGGVSAIIDEIPYIQLFIAQNCKKFMMVGPTHRTAGFGFVFPKGSPLVPDISRAVLNVTEGEKMEEIQRAWFGIQEDCPEQGGNTITSNSLPFDSFEGLFIIAGASSGGALFVFLVMFLCEHKHILASENSVSQKALSIASAFNKKKEKSSRGSKILDSSRGVNVGTASDGAVTDTSGPQVPETSNSLHRGQSDQPRQDSAKASTSTVIQVPSAEITSAN